MTTQLDRIEAKLDHILMTLGSQQQPSTTTPLPNEVVTDASHLFHNWTVRQHCVLQMVLRSANNNEIGQRMKVTTNTAKVHVRTLMRKLDVHSRSEIVAKCLIPMREVSDDTYRLMARGLPKDWDKNYAEPDPFNDLIHGKDK